MLASDERRALRGVAPAPPLAPWPSAPRLSAKACREIRERSGGDQGGEIRWRPGGDQGGWRRDRGGDQAEIRRRSGGGEACSHSCSSAPVCALKTNERSLASSSKENSACRPSRDERAGECTLHSPSSSRAALLACGGGALRPKASRKYLAGVARGRRRLLASERSRAAEAKAGPHAARAALWAAWASPRAFDGPGRQVARPSRAACRAYSQPGRGTAARRFRAPQSAGATPRRAAPARRPS